MKRKQRHIVYFFLALFDVALIIASYLLVTRIYMGSLETLAGLKNPVFPLWDGNGFILLIIYAIAVVVCYVLSRVYGLVYHGRIRAMATRVFLTNTIGIVLFAAVLYVLRMEEVSRMTLLLFYLGSTFIIILKQWITIQVLYRRRLTGSGLKPVIVVGCGTLAQRYANTIGVNSARLEHVVGYVVSRGEQASEEEIAQSCPLLRERLGGVTELDSVLEQTDVEEIIIALQTEDYDDMRLVTAAADRFGTYLTLVPFYTDVIPRSPEIDSVEGVKLVNLRSIPLNNAFNAAIKRTSTSS